MPYRRLTGDWKPFFERRFQRISDSRLDWCEEADALAQDFLALECGPQEQEAQLNESLVLQRAYLSTYLD